MAYCGRTPNVPSDLLPILRQVPVGVGKDSRDRAKEVMQNVIGKVVDSLKGKYEFVIRPQYSGSSFEGTKTEKANEFDMLIILDGRELKRDPYNPEFFYLRPKQVMNRTFRDYVSVDGYIDPGKITSSFFSWVNLDINSLFPVDSQYIVKMRRTGPAVTLSIKANPRYHHVQDFGTIDVDLVASFGVGNEEFVAKPYQPRDHKFLSGNIQYLWRKSFSLLEKEMLHGIDRDGGCRRQCLRLLKFVRLRDSTFKRLASYHYKVLLLNECNKFRNREDWVANKLAERFWGLLSSLLVCAKNAKLPHCIESRINVFERIEPIVLSNIQGRVKRVLNKGSIELKTIFDKAPIA